MKFSLWVAALTFASVSAFAAPESTVKLHMGYVDLQKALQTVEAGKTAKATLEKQMLAKKAEIEKQQKDFQKDAEAFEKKAAILNESAKAQKQAELQKRYVDLQKTAAEAQQNLQTRERELTQPIINDLKSVVEGIGKDKQFQFIVEKNEGAVLYAESGADLTTQVIEKFNSSHKGKK
jgi:outer membrane protein